MTAAELTERLQQDAEFSARESSREQRRLERAADYDVAAAPVLADLAKVGFDVESVAELYNKKIDYRSAIPVLLEWVPQISHRAVKESIVRALSVPWAKPHAARPLIDEFRRLDDDPRSSLRWAIGNALEVVSDETVFDSLVQLACDRSYGQARQMIVVALGNMRHPQAVDVLIDLLDEEDVAGHAMLALGRLRAERARPYIEPFTKHPQQWVRDEARAALKRIGSP